jgi:hypothetical protein
MSLRLVHPKSPARVEHDRMMAQRAQLGVKTFEIVCPRCERPIEAIAFSVAQARERAERFFQEHLDTAHPPEEGACRRCDFIADGPEKTRQLGRHIAHVHFPASVQRPDTMPQGAA